MIIIMSVGWRYSLVAEHSLTARDPGFNLQYYQKKLKKKFRLKNISCLWTEFKVFFILKRNGTHIGSSEKGKECLVANRINCPQL